MSQLLVSRSDTLADLSDTIRQNALLLLLPLALGSLYMVSKGMNRGKADLTASLRPVLCLDGGISSGGLFAYLTPTNSNDHQQERFYY